MATSESRPDVLDEALFTRDQSQGEDWEAYCNALEVKNKYLQAKNDAPQKELRKRYPFYPHSPHHQVKRPPTPLSEGYVLVSMPVAGTNRRSDPPPLRAPNSAAMTGAITHTLASARRSPSHDLQSSPVDGYDRSGSGERGAKLEDKQLHQRISNSISRPTNSRTVQTTVRIASTTNNVKQPGALGSEFTMANTSTGNGATTTVPDENTVFSDVRELQSIPNKLQTESVNPEQSEGTKDGDIQRLFQKTLDDIQKLREENRTLLETLAAYEEKLKFYGGTFDDRRFDDRQFDDRQFDDRRFDDRRGDGFASKFIQRSLRPGSAEDPFKRIQSLQAEVDSLKTELGKAARSATESKRRYKECAELLEVERAVTLRQQKGNEELRSALLRLEREKRDA